MNRHCVRSNNIILRAAMRVIKGSRVEKISGRFNMPTYEYECVKTRAFEYKTSAGAYKPLYLAPAFGVRAGGQRLVLHALGYLKSLFTFLALILICRHI